jgi:hypothetical protein
MREDLIHAAELALQGLQPVKIDISGLALVCVLEIKAEAREAALPARQQEIGRFRLRSSRPMEILLLIPIEA